MRIAITGAAGLVGQNLIPRLKARGGYEIVAHRQARRRIRASCASCIPTSTSSRPISPSPATGQRRSTASKPWWSPTRRSAGWTRRSSPQQRRRDRAPARGDRGARRLPPRPHQLLGGELGRGRLVHRDQEGAGAARPRLGQSLRGAAADPDVRLVRPQAPRLARALHAAGARCSRFRAMAATCASRSTSAISATSSWPASSGARRRRALQHLRPGADRLHRPDPRRARRLRRAGADRPHALRLFWADARRSTRCSTATRPSPPSSSKRW